MHRMICRTLALALLFLISETAAFAQMGMPSMGGGMGGMSMQRPKRKLKRNSAPTLSPALNMVPGVSTSFEGQFLMRTLPQEQFNRQTNQYNRQFEGLQNRIQKDEADIKSGIGKTGHSSRFMNYGGYYSMGGSSGGRGR